MKLALTGLAIAAGLCTPAHARQTTLTNTARLSFTSATGASGVNSNTTTLSVVENRRPNIRLMRLAVGAEGVAMGASTTQCLVDGKGFEIPGLDGDSEFDPDSVKLRPATSYHAGEPIFIDIEDPDSNSDPAARDVLSITIKTSLGEQGNPESLGNRAEYWPFPGLYSGDGH